MYTFRGNIAEKFGINAAVVAEYLYAGERELEYGLEAMTLMYISRLLLRKMLPI